jgi:hypothetical protein
MKFHFAIRMAETHACEGIGDDAQAVRACKFIRPG